MSDKNFKVKNGLDANGAVTITQPNTSTVPLTILANTLATGSNLLEVKRPDGTVRLSIGNDGALGAQNLSALNVRFYSANSTSQPLILRGQASQTADLQQWRDVSENVLASVSAAGSISAVDLTLSGNLTVNGTTTNLNSTNLIIEDKNIIIADVATPTDTTADGAGITIKGATDKTLSWVQSTKSFTTSEPVIINNSSTDVPTLIVKLNTGQTSNIQEWRDHAGNVVAKIGPLYGSNIFQFDPFSYGAGSGYSSIGIGGRFISNEQRAAQSKFGVTTGEWVLGALSATDSQVGAFASSTTLPTFVIKGITSQSANLQEWQNVSGTVLGFFASNGTLKANYVQTTLLRSPADYQSQFYMGAENGSIRLDTAGASTKGLVIRGSASQTANLQEWQNSDGTVLASISSTGFLNLGTNFTAPSTTGRSSGTKIVLYSSGNVAMDYGIGVESGSIWYTAPSGAGHRFYSNNTATPVLELGSSTIIANNPIIINGTNSSGVTTSPFNLTWNSFSNWGLRINQIYNTSPGGSIDYSLVTRNDSTTDINAIFIKASGLIGFNKENQTTAQVWVNNSTAGNIGLVVQGAASQTANLQEWRSSTGTTLASVESGGAFNISPTSTPNGYSLYVIGAGSSGIITMKSTATSAHAIQLQNSSNTIVFKMDLEGRIVPSSTSSIGLIVRGLASQTGDLTQWQNSDGTVLTSIRSDGSIYSALPSAVSQPIIEISIPAYHVYPGILTRSGTAWITALNPTGFDSYWQSRFAPQSTSTVPVLITGKASQTADLTQWKNSAGTVLTRIGSDGAIYRGAMSIDSYGAIYTAETIAIGATMSQRFATGGLTIINRENASAVILGIKGVASQTADLTQWRNSSDAVIANVDSAGFVNGSAYRQIGGNSNQFGNGAVISGVLTAFGPGGNAAIVPVVIKGAASQTANLQEWQNSAGTILGRVRSDGTGFFPLADIGRLFVSGIPSDWPSYSLHSYSSAANIVTLGITGNPSQTADLTQWKNGSGTVLALVDAYGRLGINTTSLANSTGGYSMVSIYNNNTVNTNLVIKSYPSQTANLQEWQNSAGTALAKVDIYGNYISNGLIVTPSLGVFTNATVQIKGTSNSNAVLALQPNSGSSTGDALVYYNATGSAALAKIDANGNFTAISKSFDIEHPTKENMRLRYASLEGPENGVYVRGTTTTNIIELPDYWTGLVYEDSITVSLTSVGSTQNIYVEKIENNKVYIGGDLEKAFFTVYGERKDIDKLIVEY